MTKRAALLVLLVSSLLTTISAELPQTQLPQTELADRQWLALYHFRHASQTKTCTVTSWEAPLSVLLVEHAGERLHMVKLGDDVVPDTDAWIRIDDGDSHRFKVGLVPPNESFAIVTEMLLGAYAHIEWSDWPSRTIKEGRAGLGFFAWSYARCRAQLGWPVPESLQGVLALRYDGGPDLEAPAVANRDVLDQHYEDLLAEFDRLRAELDELTSP